MTRTSGGVGGRGGEAPSYPDWGYKQNMARESIFNKLWVIESLPEGDLKTGTSLVDNQLKIVKQERVLPHFDGRLG